MPGGSKSLRRVSSGHVQTVRRISGDGGPTMWRGDCGAAEVGREGKSRERSRGWPTQRKRTESREPDQVLHSVVSGAVPVWVSPRTLVPDGTALMRTAL